MKLQRPHEASLRLYNTLSGKIEIVKKPHGRPLNLFVCGPTVYDDPHIGNGRTYLVFDAFVKYIHSRHLKIFYLQNITDIDDKIILRAHEEKTTPDAIAKRFLGIYMRMMRDLGIDSVHAYARATEFIPQIIKQVKTLIDKKYAYEIVGDGWYFDISKFKNYGRLSRRTVAQAEDGVSRIDESTKKKNKGDFCLWKFSKSNEPSWESEIGEGRPGWHIEDTAISEHYFGPQYDIHGGGVDLKFPHHEAEIAEQETASGKSPFVKIWLHVGALSVEGKKMSKSVGNFISIRDYLQTHSAEAFRLMVLSYHYRTPLDYSETLASEYEKKWLAILEFFGKLEALRKHRRKVPLQKIDTTRFANAFQKALENDFHTPQALAAIFTLVREVEPRLWTLALQSSEEIHSVVKAALHSLGFRIQLPKIHSEIRILTKEREKFRGNKQFTNADDLRKKIEALGYTVEDTPIGPFAWPQS